MIAFAHQVSRSCNTLAQDFESLLPAIRQYASYQFRYVHRQRRQELVAEVISTAFVAYVRLVELGRAALAYATPLARYAVRHVKAGRRVGAAQNSCDVLSEHAQHCRRFSVTRESQDFTAGSWQELIADRRATPAEIVACRLDFRSWLGHLQRFQRRVALALAQGTTTQEAAQQFRLSSARISQLRHELADSWRRFQALPMAS